VARLGARRGGAARAARPGRARRPAAAGPAGPVGPPGLLIEDLTLHPPGAARPLLSGLTLHLPPGCVWAVAGPNGAGKTTLLRAVLGLAAPQAGRVLLDGQDTWRADRAAIGPRLGYLPQEAQLLEGSVIENIGRFAGGPPAACVEAARRAGAHAVIGRLPQGYDSAAGPDAACRAGSAGWWRSPAPCTATRGWSCSTSRRRAWTPRAARRCAPAAAARGTGAVVLVVTHDPGAWHGGAVDGVLTIGGAAPGWCAEHAVQREDVA
jgi:hypothetical protein